MTDIQTAIKNAEQSARKLFGSDIRITVARAVAWGHADNCLLVNGKKHTQAAIATTHAIRGAKIAIEKSTGFMDLPESTYSVITFA